MQVFSYRESQMFEKHQTDSIRTSSLKALAFKLNCPLRGNSLD